MMRKIASGRISTLGLMVGIASQIASAQSMGLPASDPVGIGRSGTGVAFGTSLEAATLNPALLVTLRETRSAYLGLGLEIQSLDTKLETTGASFRSSDRNRILPSLGAAWRLSDSFALGFKYDQPYMRHREIPLASSLRFQSRAIDLGTRRMEAQGAWAINPQWSVGLGLGITQVDYSYQSCVRTPVSNQGLMEIPVLQEGKANAFSYTLGFRWALNPRWTIAGTYQGAIKASPTWTASTVGEDVSYVANDGISAPPSGTSTQGQALLGASHAVAGSGQIVLPARMALGVRRRVNQYFTWEVDLRYIQGGSFALPSQASLATPSGTVVGPTMGEEYRNGFGFSAMAEFSWNKQWSARVGVEILPALATDVNSNPVVGGSKSAGFSVGFGYKALGGEFSLGYQLRQSLAQDSTRQDGVWDVNGFRFTSNSVNSESKGHLLAIGYKRVF